MGQAYAYKRGDLKLGDLNPDYADSIIKISKSMSLSDLKKWASTKHTSLPTRVSEGNIMSFNMFINLLF